MARSGGMDATTHALERGESSLCNTWPMDSAEQAEEGGALYLSRLKKAHTKSCRGGGSLQGKGAENPVASVAVRAASAGKRTAGWSSR